MLFILLCVGALSQIQAQGIVSANGCTTSNPCLNTNCAENQFCNENGECECNDSVACNFGEVGECVFADTSNCLDCDGVTICPDGTTCDGNANCVADDPCDDVVCLENETCDAGDCLCNDDTACNFGELAPCVFADTDNCLDCNNETVCETGFICDGSGNCASLCSVVCDIDASEAGFDFLTPLVEIEAWLDANYPQCGANSTVSFSFEIGQEIRTLIIPSVALIPLEIKSVKVCGASTAFIPPLVAQNDVDLTSTINDILGSDVEAVFTEFIVSSDGTINFTYCGNGCNQTAGQIGVEFVNDGTTFLGWTSDPSLVTKTRTLTIGEDCTLTEN